MYKKVLTRVGVCGILSECEEKKEEYPLSPQRNWAARVDIDIRILIESIWCNRSG